MHGSVAIINTGVQINPGFLFPYNPLLTVNLFLFFSHSLTEDQTKDATNTLGITQVIKLPEALQKQWSQVPAEIAELGGYLPQFVDWLQAEARPGDYALIQGDFGMTYAMVNACKEMDLLPIYATTRRESQESVNEAGEVIKTLRFKHIRFRKYE